MTRALVFADRERPGLAPLTGMTCASLLPVAGKPALFHALESLAKAGIVECVVVASPFAERVVREVGDGARWGMRVETVLSKGSEPVSVLASRLSPRLGGEFLLMLGDGVRGGGVRPFLDAAASVPGNPHAVSGGRPAGLQLVRDASALAVCLSAGDPAGASPVEVPGGWNACETLRDYHRANLDAAAGRLPEIVLPGRETAGARVGRASRLSPASVKGRPVFVGSRCDVHPSAELGEGTVLCDDVIIDQRAVVRSTVVLPETYVGEMVELRDAIVWNNLLIRIDDGSVTRVTDAFLLSALRTDALRATLVGTLDRVLAAGLLLLSLPLWPLALLASLAAEPGAPLRWTRFESNQTEPDDEGRRRDFRVPEWAAASPVLRRLFMPLAVLGGHLSLVGVSPRPPAATAAPAEEWQALRDGAPAGLFGPVQLTLPAGCPEEERQLMDAYFAQTWTPSKNAYWLLRAAGALFTGAAWRRGG